MGEGLRCRCLGEQVRAKTEEYEEVFQSKIGKIQRPFYLMQRKLGRVNYPVRNTTVKPVQIMEVE